MRKNFGAKPWMYPQPVLIIATYDENGRADAMNAAWGGICDENQIAMCLSIEHKTVENLRKTRAFTVSMATAAYVAACDYVGIDSGNTVSDKLQKCGLHPVKSAFVNAPLIEELPMALECTLLNYDEQRMIVTGEIVNVSADERILTDGRIDPAKLEPITFDPVHNRYIKLGETVGKALCDGLRFR